MPYAPVTPVLVGDPRALDANIAAMQALADAHGVALRPHAKGHRAPWVAARQLAAGARGIAVATIAEARIFLAAGVGDVLLSTLVAPGRADTLAALARGGALTVVVDTPGGAAVLNDAAMHAQVTLPVLIDVDVGQRRGGVRSPAAARDLAGAIVATCPYLRLRGVQGYDGHLQGVRDADARAAGHAEAMARLDAAVTAVRELVRSVGAGPDLELVTTAGTATAPLAAAAAAAGGCVTELQPGSYALMDHQYAALPGVAFAQSAAVLTTVTAVLAPDEVLVDAGTRAISSELGAPRVSGLDATWEPAGDEHGRLRGDLARLRVGGIVRLVPSHTDTTVVLHGAVVPES